MTPCDHHGAIQQDGVCLACGKDAPRPEPKSCAICGARPVVGAVLTRKPNIGASFAHPIASPIDMSHEYLTAWLCETDYQIAKRGTEPKQ